MLFVDTIFKKYFSSFDKRSDTNKDANGKGTLERFNETIGHDLDNQVVPLMENLIANVLSPGTAHDRYIPYMESEMGFSSTNDTLWLSSSLGMRRAVLKALPRINRIRGTIRAYEVLFGMLGLRVSIVEYNGGTGFDSDVTFDDPNRTFDSACPACTDYDINVTGPNGVVGEATARAFKSIIKYNQPINARLRSITYNAAPVVALAGDFNLDYNEDFLITDGPEEVSNGTLTFVSMLPFFNVINKKSDSVELPFYVTNRTMEVHSVDDTKFYVLIGDGRRMNVFVNENYNLPINEFAASGPYPAELRLLPADYLIITSILSPIDGTISLTAGGLTQRSDQALLYVEQLMHISYTLKNDVTIKSNFNVPIKAELTRTFIPNGSPAPIVPIMLNPNESKAFPLSFFDGMIDDGVGGPARLIYINITAA